MTLPAPTYDLTLLLDPQVEESTRAQIVTAARTAIEAQGELLRHDDWGERPLSYPIERKPAAEYHLLQFHAGSAELLAELNHSLRITDGIMRFRIIKLKPGVPDAPDVSGAPSAARRSEAATEAEPRTRPEPRAEPEPVAEVQPMAEVQPSADAEPDVPVGEPA